ncbi:MAG: DUF4142 domain-containing protein [Gammaproteobacteria bacterium]
MELKRKAIAVAVLSLGFAMGAAAQGTPAPSSGTNTSPAAPPGSSSSGTSASSSHDMKAGKVPSADHKFIEKAARGGMAEVEMGRLAQQKATNEQVKQFGARMVADHSKANDELKQIAASKGVQVPTSLDKKHKKTMDELQKLSGAEFDRQYMKHMVADHKEDVSEFQKEAKSGKDEDIKAFAAKTLPVLQDHLKMAESTYNAVKGKKAAGTKSSDGTGMSGGASGSSGGTGMSGGSGSGGASGGGMKP